MPGRPLTNSAVINLFALEVLGYLRTAVLTPCLLYRRIVVLGHFTLYLCDQEAKAFVRISLGTMIGPRDQLNAVIAAYQLNQEAAAYYSAADRQRLAIQHSLERAEEGIVLLASRR